MTVRVRESRARPGVWLVETLDPLGRRLQAVAFSGPGAEARARGFAAAWRPERVPA